MMIYFLPFAGGSELSYNQIVNKLKIGPLRCIQCSMPGRGKRVEEKLLDCVSAIAVDIFRQIKSSLNCDSFAIFGHSMGALLAVHVLSLLKKSELPLPLHVFLSGRSGVIRASQPPLKHEMELQDFNVLLRNLGGIPNEIINDQVIMSFFRPIIRNDFKAIENYVPINFFAPNLFVTVYFGDREEFSANEAKSWQRITNEKIDVKCFHGGHFFIFDHVEEIVNDIYFKLRP